jgi:hypothetical protein
MQDQILSGAAAPGSLAASGGIKVNATLLITGIVGLLFLVLSWMCVIEILLFPAFAGYSVLPVSKIEAAILISAIVVCGLMFIIMRWIARGLLEGKRARAIVACTLMLGFAACIGLTLIFRIEGLTPAMAANIGIQALLAVLVSSLLIASFRDRGYWGRRR